MSLVLILSIYILGVRKDEKFGKRNRIHLAKGKVSEQVYISLNIILMLILTLLYCHSQGYIYPVQAFSGLILTMRHLSQRGD